MFDEARIGLTQEIQKQLFILLKSKRNAGDVGAIIKINAILALNDGVPHKEIARVLQCSVQSVYRWLEDFISRGFDSLKRRFSSGRPSKLTKKQKIELGELIDYGPFACGYPGACWRSPIIQDLIFKKFGKFYSVKYIAQLLKNMGFSFQKAKFISDHLDEEKRKEWLEKTWPEILTLAKRKNSLIMFGDEVSFPMWGSLSHTWSRRGSQPVVKTSGMRKGRKVFGLICYNNGFFFRVL